MTNYHTKGFIVMYRKGNEFGTEQVHFQFDGAQDYNDLREWATSRGFTCQPPTLKPTDVYLTSGKQTEYQTPKPPCPIHGAGKWVMPNKGRGKHKFYCAHQIGEGEYCGQKIG